MYRVDLNKFYSIGHRGMEIDAVENTRTAFQKAIDLNVDLIETDVQTTKDNIPILFHDNKLDKKTTLVGCTRDYNLADLRKITITTSAGKDKIATLEELIILLQRSKTNILLELKDPFCFPYVDQLIEKYEFQNR